MPSPNCSHFIKTCPLEPQTTPVPSHNTTSEPDETIKKDLTAPPSAAIRTSRTCFPLPYKAKSQDSPRSRGLA